MSNAPSVSTADFLSAFFPDEEEKICIRRIEPKGAPKSDGRHNGVITRRQLASSEATKRQLEKLSEQNGLYFLVNSGGHEDKDITRFNAFFIENDDLTMVEQHALLSAAPLPPSIRVETKKSVHAYWLIEGDCAEEEWRAVQERLIAFFNGDRRIKNPSRCMRLPGFMHVTYNGEDEPYTYKMVEVVEFRPDKRFTVGEMLSAFPEPVAEKKAPREKSPAPSPDSVNSEFDTMEELNDELKRRVILQGRLNRKGNYEMRCPAHDGRGETSLFYSPETGAVKCLDGCSHGEVLKAFGLPERPRVIGIKNRHNETKKGVEETEGMNEENGAGTVEELDVCMADVVPQKVEWLIEPYIPLGKLTLVEGDPDEGKSFAMLAIAAAITSGGSLPFGELAEPGNVILLSAEDGRADTIRPRLDSLGADTSRVFAVSVPLVLNDEGYEKLERLVIKRNARMVLFDPLFAYVGGRADITQDNKVRAITSRLADIAERHRCSIVALRHLPKAQQRNAKMAGISSIAWTASARSVLLFGHDPEDEQARGFVHTKHNLPSKGTAQCYRIEDLDGTPRFRWTGASDLTAEKILYSQNTCGDKSELQKAEDFLFDILQGGAVLQKEIVRRASKARISSATLRRAKMSLDVKSDRPNAKSGWFWKLPGDTWPWENSDAQTEQIQDEHMEFQDVSA